MTNAQLGLVVAVMVAMILGFGMGAGLMAIADEDTAPVPAVETVDVPDDYGFLKECYDLMQTFLDAPEESEAEERAFDDALDLGCWP